MNDLKFAFRQLLKNPGFTAVAVLTLALGIGANTAIFGVINELLLRPLPVKDPDELRGIVLTDNTGDFSDQSVPYPIVQDYRELSRSALREFAAYATTFAPADIGGRSEFAVLELVTAGYFPMLGVVPEAGRFFGEADDSISNPGDIAVLSYGAWQRWFGGDPAVLGKTFTLRPAYAEPLHCTVVGIAPEGFKGLDHPGPQIWLPAAKEKSFKDAARSLVLGGGMKLAGIGVALGIVGALGLTRVLTAQLYEIKPTDPVTFAGVSLVLLCVALLASWLPARRAAHVDPMVALRAE